jgi:cytochrome c-type biogenesis protein CcmH
MRRALAPVVTLGLAAVIVVGVATADQREPDRARALAARLRCPVCTSESVADSPAPIAADMRAEIERMVEVGRSDDDIVDHFTSRYGDGILLDPPVGGRTLVVWLLPALGLVVGLGAIVALRRRQPVPELTPEERALVAAERRRAQLAVDLDEDGLR